MDANEQAAAIEQALWGDKTPGEKAAIRKQSLWIERRNLMHQMGELSIRAQEGRLEPGRAMLFSINPSMIGPKESMSLRSLLSEEKLSTERTGELIDQLEHARGAAIATMEYAGPNCLSDAQRQEVERKIIEAHLVEIMSRAPGADHQNPDDWRRLQDAFRTSRQAESGTTLGQRVAQRLGQTA